MYKKNWWSQQKKKRECEERALVPAGLLFFFCLVSDSPLLAPLLPFHPRWLCPSVEVCYFLGCVFVLTVVLQAARVPAAEAAHVCNRAAHCTGCTGCTGGAQAAIWARLLPSLNQTVCCHSAQKGLPRLTFVFPPSPFPSSPSWASLSFETQIFRNVCCLCSPLDVCLSFLICFRGLMLHESSTNKYFLPPTCTGPPFLSPSLLLLLLWLGSWDTLFWYQRIIWAVQINLTI